MCRPRVVLYDVNNWLLLPRVVLYDVNNWLLLLLSLFWEWKRIYKKKRKKEEERKEK